MWKKITSKSLKKNKTLLYSTLIELAFQMAFFHWNMHGKKSYIYTIQNAILSICLFKIASPIGDALRVLSCLHMLSCRVSVVNGCWSIFFSEFLNVDDDMGEEDDDGMPGPEDARLLDNSGWSSRTRCVLQGVRVHMTFYWMIRKQSLVCVCMYLFVCVHSCRI